MNSPTVNLSTLSLLTPLCLSSSSSMTQSVWFLSQFWSLVLPLLLLPLYLPLSSSVIDPPLSAPDCESALLWQFCCRALLTCMSCCICYEFTNGSSSSKKKKCLACACSAPPQQTWQCWTHAPSTLWPGLPKEPPQANSTLFLIISAHSAPHTVV